VRSMVLGLLIGFLAVANYRGVISGTRLSNFFTITKVLVVLFFIVAGLIALLLRSAVRVIPQPMSVTGRDWLAAVLLMINSPSRWQSRVIFRPFSRLFTHAFALHLSPWPSQFCW
jgi:amino acid transporter